MARSVLSLVGLVALLVILHAAVPGRADIELNTITSEWLVEWLKAIPNLKIIWMSPEICSRSGIVCSDDQKTLAIRLDSVTTAGFNLIGTLPEVPTVRGNSVLQVTGVSVRGKLRISGTIPESWSKMPLLTTLDLSRTGITGSIPDSLNALNSLVSAYFAGSYFCSGMPNWDSTGMPKLSQVSFGYNNMHGTFASSWSTFPSSMNLILKGNQLCGCMPSSWKSPNLITAATAMDAATVDNCKRECTKEELAFCPEPPAHPSVASAQVVTLSALLVALAAIVMSFVY